MKKVFMPSMDGLYQMQDRGIDIYSYLVAKAVESLTMNGTVLSKKGILNKKYIYKYIEEDPEIILPICRMHPELIPNFKVAYNDIDLCKSLINKKNSEYGLDNLYYFEQGTGVLNNQIVIKNVIQLLILELRNNPKYRFEYKSNSLLDNIFSTKVLNDIFCNLSDVEILSLLEIEPFYGILLGDIKQGQIKQGVDGYLNRYNIDTTYGEEYKNKDILTNPNNKIKRLLKTIKTNEL